MTAHRLHDLPIARINTKATGAVALALVVSRNER